MLKCSKAQKERPNIVFLLTLNKVGSPEDVLETILDILESYQSL